MDSIELTREHLSTSRVIARGHGVREVSRLVAEYGGKPRLWTKKSTKPLKDGDGRFFEYHWYEHHGIGRFEIKRVGLDGPYLRLRRT